MNEKQNITVSVELTEFEIDVVTDYAAEWGETLEEFLANAAEERAREVAYDAEWNEEVLSQEEIEEFSNNYHNDRLIDFLRDARKHGED